jgi:hypothetical protein
MGLYAVRYVRRYGQLRTRNPIIPQRPIFTEAWRGAADYTRISPYTCVYLRILPYTNPVLAYACVHARTGPICAAHLRPYEGCAHMGPACPGVRDCPKSNVSATLDKCTWFTFIVAQVYGEKGGFRLKTVPREMGGARGVPATIPSLCRHPDMGRRYPLSKSSRPPMGVRTPLYGGLGVSRVSQICHWLSFGARGVDTPT